MDHDSPTHPKQLRYDRAYLRMAAEWAQLSHCTRKQVGALIVRDRMIIADGFNGNGQRNTQGRVTSTYYSPTLKKGIAMGLVKGGMDRLGDVVEFNTLTTTTVKARVVDPVFYDKDGEKGNA